MAIEIFENSNASIELAGIREPNEGDPKLGCESILVAKDEVAEDSYVYVEEEGKDQGEVRVYGESITKDLLADGSTKQIEIIALEGVPGDCLISNSDDKGVNVKEIACRLCLSDVSGVEREDAELNFHNAIHHEEIQPHVTEDPENGFSIYDGQVYGSELESYPDPNAVCDVRLDETERESPAMNHGTESESTKSFFCEISESESPVLVNHDNELNEEALPFSSANETYSPEPNENTLESGSEGGEIDNDDRLELVKEKMKQDIFFNLVVDGDHHVSHVTVTSASETMPHAVHHDEAGDAYSDGQVDKGKGKTLHSLCVYNSEDADPTLFDAPQVGNLESDCNIQESLSTNGAEDADFICQVAEEKLDFTVPDNHGGGIDPYSDDIMNEVPEIQSIELVHEIQKFHAEGSLNAEAGAVESNCDVDESEQMESPLSINYDEGGDPSPNNTFNKLLQIEFLESGDDVHKLQVDVQSDQGGAVGFSDQLDEENEMEPLVIGNGCNGNGLGCPFPDEMVNEMLESSNEIHHLHANDIVKTTEISVGEVRIIESTVEDDILQSHCECRVMNVNGGITRTEAIGFPCPTFSNGASEEEEAKDGTLVMDEDVNIEKDAVAVFMNGIVEDDTKIPKDMIEGKHEIENNGGNTVDDVIHKGLRVDGLVNGTAKAPSTGNIESAKTLAVANVAAALLIHRMENGVEKETLANSNVVENVEFSKLHEVTSNVGKAVGDYRTVQAECEPAFTDVRIAETVPVESAEVNPMEYVDVVGEKCKNVGAKDNESIDKKADSEEIQPNGGSNFSAVNCDPGSLSGLDEQHESLLIKSSTNSIPISLSQDGSVDNHSLPIKDTYVNKTVAGNGTANSPSGFKTLEAVHVDGVPQSNLEFPLVFGSFEVIARNGTYASILEGSNASIASRQLEDAIHTNGTVSNDEECSTPLDKEVTSNISAFEVKKADGEAGRQPIYAIVRVPRPVDNTMKEKIRQEKVRVDDLTEKRDAINAAVQRKQIARQEIIERLRAARSEIRVVKDAELSKRKQMDSIQSIRNKMKTATSVEEHDERILSIQHRLEHETVPLKEEKQLIREINQLTRIRDKLSLDMKGQSDIHDAFDRKEEIEGNLKILEQEFSSLRKEITQTDANIKSIEKELSDVDQEIAILRSQVASANNVRQEAYLNLKNLKQQEYERNNPFYQNRRDIHLAHELARAKDLAALEEHCSNQRERMMELWNANVEFRRDYIKNNEMSILRRFGTLDGRHLGPDEEPPMVPRPNENVASSNTPQPSSLKNDTALPVPTTEFLAGGKPVAVDKAEGKVHAEKAHRKTQTHLKNLSLNSPKVEKITVTEITSSASDGGEKAKQEEKKPSEAEVRRLQEEEEKRVEEEAVKLKEQRRQEEIAKAKEAEERKRRNAEKAKVRAEARARKLTEEKEKGREKRAKKKAAAAAAVVAVADVGVDDETAALSSNQSDSLSSSTPEAGGKEKNAAKKITNPRSYPISSKTSRQKSVVPPPFRRNRRRMKPWIYGTAGCLVVVLLVFVAQRFYF